MRTLAELQHYLTEKANENKQAIKECQENIEKTEQAITRAEGDLMTAEEAVDVGAYDKAKNDIWTAQHSKELHIKQKEKLVTEPLITKAEYNNLLAEITQNANAAHEEQNDRAAALIAELKKIADESSQISQQANSIMHILQYDLYKDADALVTAKGTKITQEKQYRNEQTVHHFYNYKVKGTDLSKRAGEQPEQPRIRHWGS